MEVLLVSALGLTISYGVLKVNEVSMQTSKVVNSALIQRDLRTELGKALGDKASCVHNLKNPTSSSPKTSIDVLQTAGGVTLIDGRANQNLFKTNLRIQKLEFKNSKDFSIYYSKEGLGRYETLPKADGTKGVCTSADTSGCYSIGCKIDFSCSNNHCDGAGDKCSLTTCTESVVGIIGGGANCYMVETEGNKKTLVGCGGASDSGGTKTTALGFGAGKVNTGNMNTFLGAGAGYKNTTAERNTFVGEGAGYNSTGEKNTFVGVATGYNNTGARNTFLGTWAGHNNTAGYHNAFVGESAGFKNTTGNMNTFLGTGAGYNNTTGHINTFIGRYAGNKNTTGEKNTFIGETAGLLNTTGELNTFVGLRAGADHTTGEGNTFLGTQAGRQATTGRNNTFIGYQSGWQHTTGSNNIAIGHQTTLGPGSNQINIGKMIKAGSGYIKICDVNGNNCLRIKGREKTVSGKKIGVLQICNSSGGECIILSKESLKCPQNRYFRGINNDGTPICPSLPGGTPQTLGNTNNIRLAGAHCGSGRYLNGFNSDGTLKCVNLPNNRLSMDCGSGKYLRGIRSNGSAICGNLPRGVHVQTCPAGSYVVGFYENGRIRCSPLKPKGVPRCATYEHVRGFNSDGSLACVNPWANKTWCGSRALTGFTNKGFKVCAPPPPRQGSGGRENDPNQRGHGPAEGAGGRTGR